MAKARASCRETPNPGSDRLRVSSDCTPTQVPITGTLRRLTVGKGVVRSGCDGVEKSKK